MSYVEVVYFDFYVIAMCHGCTIDKLINFKKNIWNVKYWDLFCKTQTHIHACTQMSTQYIRDQSRQ